MASTLDPATGQPLPADAIQRVLYVCRPVHVYAIPPLMSMKGYAAADWTVPDLHNGGKTREIFTARLRILETAIPMGPGNSSSQEKVKVDILLEDTNTGDLFAAAPYIDASVVEHAIDSSRFFAMRVVGDQGRKAVLGIGFEDRSEAFDFGVALQEARKVLGINNNSGSEQNSSNVDSRKPPGRIAPSAQVGVPGRRPGMAAAPVRGRMGVPGPRNPQQPQRLHTPEPPPVDTKPKDYSLKPGQTITLNIGNRPKPNNDSSAPEPSAAENQRALFSILPPPPPSSGFAASADGDSQDSFPLIPPPPSSNTSRTDRRRRPLSSATLEPPVIPVAEEKDDESPAFDDDFGDFQ